MTALEIPAKSSIPFVDFKRRYSLYKQEILAGVDAVFSSGNYILGQFVEEFESAVSQYLGSPYVLAVANGTDAIILALKVLGIGEGDEVIIPVNSFIASAGAVVAVGAKPVFCDVTDDLNIDVSKIESIINKKTKAIIPVHLTGRSANMEAIVDIAKKHSLFVVEDAAQSIGAKFNNKMTGAIGDFGCFSLHPLKNLYVYGDGGIVVTNDETYYKKLKLLRNHGLLDRDTCATWGLNSRLDSVQAKLANIGLKYLDEWTAKRRNHAQYYSSNLNKIVYTPNEGQEYFSVYHNFVILTEKRDELMQYLMSNGIETKVHYPIPMHLQPAAKSLGYKKGDFPVAERLATQMLSLPVHSDLMIDEREIVVNKIEEFFSKR